ncbi:MAG: ABC transporter ATP-binding protein [Planctomycetota bacterium]
MPTRITLSGLTKTYGRGSKATTAVDAVDLAIEPGELFFLLGPSGCGKTTLLRMIAGFIQPNAGTIRFDDRDVTGQEPNKRNTGMVFQSYALWPHMTVADNVGFGLKTRTIGRQERQVRIDEALADVKMSPYAARRPGELSGGQQQRVALARALVVRPSVLLLDEPLSNLDAGLRAELRDEIRRICKDSGITSIYVTHDQKEALSIGDRIALMSGGRIVQSGSPSELYRRPRDAFAASFLGETNLLSGRSMASVAPEEPVEVSTPMGVLRGTAAHALRADETVGVSIRPEALSIATDGPFVGTVQSTTYLGDTAQHRVRMGDGLTLTVSQFAPAGEMPSGQVRLRTDAADVVVFPG